MQTTLVLPTVERKDLANIFSLGGEYYVMSGKRAVEPIRFEVIPILILMEWWQEFFLISCGSNFSASGTSNVFTETDQVFMRECLFFQSPWGGIRIQNTKYEIPFYPNK